MKNQYFGDVNDYRKYGLLRALQSSGDGRLLVAWMLTPDDGGCDGKFLSYLGAPALWEKYDPILFNGLNDLLSPAAKRCVSLIEGSDLLPTASYYSELVPDKRQERDAWCSGLRRAAAGADLVFLDPDNGIEVRSKPAGRRGSSKYVMWGEIERLWAAGCSLVIYQHFPRKPRHEFAEQIAAALRSRTGAGFVEALRTAHVLFLVAAQDRHKGWLGNAMKSLRGCWNGQIEVMGLAN